MVADLLDIVRRGVGPLADPRGDEDLLADYFDRRDEAAFAALVWRHGRMVIGVCRRLLCHDQDAEDAFQATFLVLAQRADGIRRRDRLGHWLYGVAHRTALEARTLRARRQARERNVDALPDVSTRGAVPDDRPALVEREVSQLPRRYRLPIVYCDLGGLGRREAARRLGIAEGTLSSRLARGRKLLARRLTRRGLALGVTVAAARECGAGAVPTAWALQAARAATGGVGAAEAFSVAVTGLAKRVRTDMFINRVKILATAAVAVAVLACGAAALRAGGQAPAPPAAPPAAAPKEKAKDPLKDLQGEWKVEGHVDKGGTYYQLFNLGWTIKGDQLTMNWVLLGTTKNGTAQRATIKFGVKAKGEDAVPANAIDLIVNLDPTETDAKKAKANELHCPGVYEIDGDTLKICFRTYGDGSRPAGLAAEDFAKLWTLSRVKN